jgi:hypothetical protein
MACQVPDRPDRGIRHRALSSFYLADPRQIGSHGAREGPRSVSKLLAGAN